MKKLIPAIMLLIMSSYAKADDDIETYNIISNEYIDDVNDAQLIRMINGGSVIIPVFDDSCPEEMKAPFLYACKIVEEYIPPCLPLKVQVSCGRLNGSSNNSISKVLIRSLSDFGYNSPYKNAPMSMIKAILLAEYDTNTSETYLGSIPNISFLTEKPDIQITYNQTKLNEITFSLEANPGNNYDFVSLAVRDLLIGLGITSSYRYNPITQGLEDPVNNMIPFESYINKILGNNNDSTERLRLATNGELTLIGNLKLYAPSTWINGLSLNYFIPQDNNSISKILSYDFCKGMVTRNITSSYNGFIFKSLLGWFPDMSVGSSGTTSENGGSTEIILPYNGSISFDGESSYGIRMYTDSFSQNLIATHYDELDERIELMEYLNSFRTISDEYGSGVSLSILKKDGTWDEVFFFGLYLPELPIEINMSDCEFHFDEDEYARTIDGYLRARYSTKYRTNFGRTLISSTFFVVDYLPQKVNINYSFIDNIEVASVQDGTVSTNSSCSVRLFFSNLEGINRLVLERVRNGFRVPTKIEVTDFKKGYFDTTIDRETTFTAVGYNNNGTSRGVPITITPTESVSVLNFSITGNIINLVNNESEKKRYEYRIIPIDRINSSTLTGECNETIDISDLGSGIYLLYTNNIETGETNTFKFKK